MLQVILHAASASTSTSFGSFISFLALKTLVVKLPLAMNVVLVMIVRLHRVLLRYILNWFDVLIRFLVVVLLDHGIVLDIFVRRLAIMSFLLRFVVLNLTFAWGEFHFPRLVGVIGYGET